MMPIVTGITIATAGSNELSAENRQIKELTIDYRPAGFFLLAFCCPFPHSVRKDI